MSAENTTEAHTIHAVYFVGDKNPKIFSEHASEFSSLLCDNSLFLNPIAIRPTLLGQFLFWEDTSKGRCVTVKRLHGFYPCGFDCPDCPEIIEIELEGGKTLFLQKLTLQLYETCVKRLTAGEPEFQSDQELQLFYLSTDFQSY